MFINISLSYLIGPIGLIIAAVVFFQRSRIDKSSDSPLNKAMGLLRMYAMATAVVAIALWFLLPQTPVLSTFGYPKATEDIQTPALLLDYLQNYNKALVRTTEVLYWFIFTFVWWFLVSFFSISKLLVPAKKDEPKQNEAVQMATTENP